MAKKGKYYAVVGKEKSGVFKTLNDAKNFMNSQKKASIRKFLSMEAAKYFIRTGRAFNFYVVREGRGRGIFSNFEDCARQVYQFRGSVFRRFDWLPFATSYYDLPDGADAEVEKEDGEKSPDDPLGDMEIGAEEIVVPSMKPPLEWSKSNLPEIYRRMFLYVNDIPQDSKVEIYTDGSAAGRWYGWAYVAFWNGCIVYDASGGGYAPEKNKASLIAETEAVKNAVLWAEMNRLHEAVIISDFQGVVNALNWQKMLKQKSCLHDFIEWMRMRPVKTVRRFKFVKGHAGTLGNMMADYFASVARMKFQPCMAKDDADIKSTEDCKNESCGM